MKVTITGVDAGYRISAIKGLRMATGMGLKEAKEIIDDVYAGKTVKLEVSSVEPLDTQGVVYKLHGSLNPFSKLFAITGDFKWGTPIPVWVSRPTADGMVSKYTVPMWFFLFAGLLLMVLFTLWGIIALVVAFKLIIGALI